MPIYPFQCDGCGAEFEVSRKISAMRDPAACPACGREARRVFTPLAVGGLAKEPPKPGAKPKPGKPGAGGWSHGGHSHGAGTGAHTHGMWGSRGGDPGAGKSTGASGA